MSVSHITSSTYTLGSETTLGRILIPSSVVSGHDLYLLVASDGHTASIARPTVGDTDAAGNIFALQGEVPASKGLLYWKKATANTASKLITVSGTVDVATAGLSVYSGGWRGGNPTTNVTGETSGTGNLEQAGFLPSFANSMICLGVFNFFSNQTVDTMACDNPVALTSRFSVRQAVATSVSLAHGSAEQPGALSSTGTFTWEQASAVTSRSLVWAIRPEILSQGSGTTLSPTHTYANAGTYTITLTVTDNLGASSTTSQSVTVS